jgi:hypothetical protein
MLIGLPILLVGICAILNHLGGQSTTIPFPRFTCRMLGQGAAFGLIGYLSGLSSHLAIFVGIFGLLGMIIWGAPSWGAGFMAVRTNMGDTRDYDSDFWLTSITDSAMGVGEYTRLSRSEIRNWGMMYMTLRGGFMIPLFVWYAYLLTPWALPIGLLCLLQGVAYRISNTVYDAEFIMGSLIGGQVGSLIIIHLLGG